MTIPTASDYPLKKDTDTNLFIVHDALRMQLAEDYTVGDISITVTGDDLVMERFPSSGIITLTEQVSDIDKRAISLYYGSRTSTTFDELELLPEFDDVDKPKRITNVTLNVVAEHHNALKDALIAVEEFIGVKGTIDTSPGGATIVGRLNFLRKLMLSPRAWFSVDKTIGLVPLEVTFTDESFRLGKGEIIYTWNFGDSEVSSISNTICVTSNVPSNNIDVYVKDLDGGTVTKTYTSPGIYDVTLTVQNENGEDTVVFSELINARIPAPGDAVMEFTPRTGQIFEEGDPLGGPFTTPPKIKSAVNTFIDIEVPSGENPSTPDVSYAGEALDGSGDAIDPIIEYTWSLSDDLNHANESNTRAVYSIGGIYDLKLRVDTLYGAYKITTYENSINIVEKRNLWLWTFQSSTEVKSYEFGLLSETFKNTSNNETIVRDDSFLDGSNNEDQAKQEFYKNSGFATRSTTTSGDRGNALLFWASGGAYGGSLLDHEINIKEYEGFSDTYIDLTSISSKPWNWAHFASPSNSYFVFGQEPTITAFNNGSYQEKTTYDHQTLSYSNSNLTSGSYVNGANELEQHISDYDESGIPENGYFAVYRTTWKDQNGYMVRNDNVGEFFRIKSFYRTEGIIGDLFQTIRKLPDIGGFPKLEGELVSLTNGIFFFNNSGNISAFNTTSNTWETGSISFNALQDTSVTGFGDESNTLLATSDGDRNAYLSYDYSTNAFIKFNGTDNTFISLSSRPTGDQWMMGVY